MCKQCELKPVYEFTNQRKLCKTCFIRYFQKKVLYIIRKFEMIKYNDVIGYKTGKDFSSVVLENVLKIFVEKSMVELVEMPSNTPRVYPEKSFSKIFTKGKKKPNKIAVASTIDLKANEIISILIKGNVKDLEKLKPINKKIIKPLYLFLDKEVLLYAKLKKLKFVKNKRERKDKIGLFIDELEKKHPEVKRAIVNSYLKLQNCEL